MYKNNLLTKKQGANQQRNSIGHIIKNGLFRGVEYLDSIVRYASVFKRMPYTRKTPSLILGIGCTFPASSVIVKHLGCYITYNCSPPSAVIIEETRTVPTKCVPLAPRSSSLSFGAPW